MTRQVDFNGVIKGFSITRLHSKNSTTKTIIARLLLIWIGWDCLSERAGESKGRGNEGFRTSFLTRLPPIFCLISPLKIVMPLRDWTYKSFRSFYFPVYPQFVSYHGLVCAKVQYSCRNLLCNNSTIVHYIGSSTPMISAKI